MGSLIGVKIHEHWWQPVKPILGWEWGVIKRYGGCAPKLKLALIEGADCTLKVNKWLP